MTATTNSILTSFFSCFLCAAILPAKAAGDVMPQVSTEASSKLAQARERALKAKILGNAWTSTDALLDQAKEAEAKGDSKAVIQLAEEATKQAELSIEQVKSPLVE